MKKLLGTICMLLFTIILISSKLLCKIVVEL